MPIKEPIPKQELDTKVKAAKEVAEQFGYGQVVIIGIDSNDGIISGASYGTTKRKCTKAKSKMDAAYDAVVNYIRRN